MSTKNIFNFIIYSQKEILSKLIKIILNLEDSIRRPSNLFLQVKHGFD